MEDPHGTSQLGRKRPGTGTNHGALGTHSGKRLGVPLDPSMLHPPALSVSFGSFRF